MIRDNKYIVPFVKMILWRLRVYLELANILINLDKETIRFIGKLSCRSSPKCDYLRTLRKICFLIIKI